MLNVVVLILSSTFPTGLLSLIFRTGLVFPAVPSWLCSQQCPLGCVLDIARLVGIPAWPRRQPILLVAGTS